MTRLLKTTVAVAIAVAQVAAVTAGIVASSTAASAGQFKAKADYLATRKRGWLPEFKGGTYIAYGPTCAAAFAKGRRSVSGSGWTIKAETNQRCTKT